MCNSSKNVFLYFSDLIKEILKAENVETDNVLVERPKDKNFGDLTTNIAMVLAKREKRNPIEIAEDIKNLLKKHDAFENISVAKPGFINWKINKDILRKQIFEILNTDYGRPPAKNKKINIEYVSANPTGPLHAGHARGAVVGDALANLLIYAGYDVTKEYYINDAGNQIINLSRTLYYRYAQILDKKFGKHTVPDELGENMYPGDYMIDLAEKLIDEENDRFYEKPESEWLEFLRIFAVKHQMEIIKEDLKALGIQHDIFTSEKSLVDNGMVEKCIEFLKEKGLIYYGTLTPPKGKKIDDWEAREQLLFRSSQFGDDTDRPLQKSDGSWTYFATDIAYHFDKFNRGFDELIDFWGADHGGYVKRMASAITALTGRSDLFSVKICQLVKFMDNGKEVKMSKRAGTFITARDVIDKVGKDVVRFIMLTRKDDANLDFDFNKVVEQTKENPVFYVQYALARTYSVLKQFRETFNLNGEIDCNSADLSFIESPQEFELTQVLSEWPKLVELAAKLREPHRIAFYLYDLAGAFHSLWNSGKAELRLRFINEKDFASSLAKVVLVLATQKIIETGLKIIGVTPVKELR